MLATEEMTITLSADMAALVRSKVATGEYDSESQVIEDGLEALMESNPAFEQWLLDEVVPALKAYEADPTRAVSIDVVKAELQELYAGARAAR